MIASYQTYSHSLAFTIVICQAFWRLICAPLTEENLKDIAGGKKLGYNQK